MRIRIITLLLLITLSLNGAIYYVAPTGGSDSNVGTNMSAPWATWQKAFLTAVAGDTVYFRGGVWEPTVAYNGNNICLIRPDAGIGHNGEPGNPISFLNYPGETPILDCHLVNTGGAFITGLQLEDVHFINWRGLTIRNIYQRVQYVEAGGIRGEAISNMNWERIDLHNIGGHGWYVESDVGPDYISYDLGWDESGYIPYDTTTYLNCDTWQCADTLLVNNAEGQSPGNMGDGFKHINGGAHITYTGCRAWHCADDGFDMPGFGVTILRNCWSFANGIQDASWEGNGFKFGASDIVPPSPRRILTNCISAYNVNGVGFFNVEYDGYHRDMARVHNVVSYMDGTAFALNDNTTYPNSDTEFRNCYAYKTVKTDPGGRPNVIEANCYYIESNNNWDYAIVGSLGRWDWATDIIVSDADFVSVDSTQLLNTRETDGSLPNITFLTLIASSDLLDAGIDVGLSYNGGAPDVGYAEYEETQASNATDIVSFYLSEQTGLATINSVSHTISIEVEYGTNITSISPSIGISYGAAISPASGVSRNFSSPQTYTITAEDDVTEQVWTVTVIIAEEPIVERPIVSGNKFTIHNGIIVKL